MIQKIKTKKKEIIFHPTREFFEKKKIDRKISKENILLLREILIKKKIRWGLIFGTLLGAVREKNFIEHDKDTDIFVFDEDKQEFLELLHLFQDKGFRVIRFEKSQILSIERKNEWIDFFFFKKTFFGRKCRVYFIKDVFFKNLNEIKFFNKNFPTVCDVKKYLQYQYGDTWNISIKNSYAKGNYFSFGDFGRRKLPFLYYKIYLTLRKKIQNFKK